MFISDIWFCFRAEYEASREPYEDQKQLCMTLITYLQSLTPADHSDATGSGDSHDATQSENIDLGECCPYNTGIVYTWLW